MLGRDLLPQGRLRRTMPLAGFTARAASGRLVAGLREKAGKAGAVAQFHEQTAISYAELLGHSKGVLMKAGQIFSMVDAGSVGNGQLLPYQKALTRLQADAPPMDARLAREVLLDDLGRPVESAFAEFDDEPMAAASIGQVHRAVLLDGRQVVVKIQYPGVASAIREDLANTELLTTFFRVLTSASGIGMYRDLREWTQEITARIGEETDYRREAANITAFNRLYRDHPFIRIPEVIDKLSGERVLTMTHLEGLDWAAAQAADQDLKNTWAEVILRFVMSSYRHANLFHADPHPGNYRFGLDGTVGFVDFGCVKMLDERLRRNGVALLRAGIEGRKRELRDQMVKIGFFAHDSTITSEEAYEWYADIIYEVIAPQPVTYTPETTSRAIRALIDVRSKEHVLRRMSVPGDLLFTTRINLSVNAICAALQATVDAKSMVDEMDGVRAPLTPMGQQHDIWVRQRGLPYGLDPR
ncbi:ABC1 kinase family protein [Mycobacterium vicinigordonae]|uniref:AarF/ABC1/UbiB kinase family protein n=1 Tax=Mycobacterium vicinigordonae TaxID=1719132 RepID=A0A7D6IKX5_9MYCO|nr:AarF/ABC1/UbiB kinase family protein [Mycobacterium vicinigordonae]QLL06600.1 AarF/ABC1/UbiB kinase family protein [Mycobacterium vicinigordonae]